MLILGEFIRSQDLELVCVLLQQDLHTFQKEINRRRRRWRRIRNFMGPRSNLFSRRPRVQRSNPPLWGGAEIMRARDKSSARRKHFQGGPTDDQNQNHRAQCQFPAPTGGIRILAGRYTSARPGINKASAKHCKLTRLISCKAAERRSSSLVAAYQLSTFAQTHRAVDA